MTPPARMEVAWCNVCAQPVKDERFKCLTCPDWDCCAVCEPRHEQMHPGHKLVRLTAANDIPKNPCPTQWVPHPGVTCNDCAMPIVGPRFKCSLCTDLDLCASCEANPMTSHQKEMGAEHLLVKIDVPLPDEVWARTLFGSAPTRQGVDNPVHEDASTTAVVARPSTSNDHDDDDDDDTFPPLPEDPFSGTGTPTLDFLSAMRGVTQVVGLGRGVMSHPYLQQAAPALQHVTAFLSALQTPANPQLSPHIDLQKLSRAIEQLISAATASSMSTPSPMPTQADMEAMLSVPRDPMDDPDDVDDGASTDPPVVFNAPAMSKGTDPLSSTFTDALSDNFRQMMAERV